MTSQWKSSKGFMFAAIGGAIGLGNIWRFPYELGQNGGAAFLIIYIAFVILICLPLIAADTYLGRYTKQGSMTLFGKIAKLEGKSRHWKYVGWFIASSSFILCSYYSVIAGTTAAYAYESIVGTLNNISTESAAALYKSYETSPIKLSLWHAIMMIATGVVLSKQINQGIEKLVSIVIPLFFVLLLFLIVFAAVVGDFLAGVKFLFEPDFSKISVELAISALGQAFFSIGVGMGVLSTLGAYLPKGTSIIRSSAIICFADTLVAILAGLCIFPLVFGFGMEADVGSALVFNTLTVAFGQMQYGSVVATAFFALLAIAGLTTLIALLEQLVSYLSITHEMSRKKAATIVCGAAFSVGMLAVLSTNILASVKIIGMNFADLFDWWIAQVGLPVGGMLTAIFVGWLIKKEHVISVLGSEEKYVFQIYFLIRYFCPVAILVTVLAQFIN
jgi:neurotransmitter:Na+ symporter, NSS family